MSSHDRLKKLNSGGYKFENPYVEDIREAQSKKTPTQPARPEPKEKGIIDYEGHVMGRMRVMQDEIDNLRMDVLTLLQIIQEDYPDMSISVARQKYYDFRAGAAHVSNRIINKLDSINESEFKINDKQA